MAITIYEKPTRALLKDMLVEWKLEPGQVFTTDRVVKWFTEHFPKINPGSVLSYLVQAATNDMRRLDRPAINETDDVLFKVDSGQFRLYAPATDPAPIHELVEGDIAQKHENSQLARNTDEPGRSYLMPGSSKLLLKRDLHRYLSKNLECIEPGLSLYENEDLTGINYEDTGCASMDILAKDKAGSFVVMQLTASHGYYRVLGKLLRYMYWVRRELAEPGQRVRGIIICRSMSEDLRLACASMSDVELCEYQLSFTVSKVPK